MPISDGDKRYITQLKLLTAVKAFWRYDAEKPSRSLPGPPGQARARIGGGPDDLL
jgi:hypothetical protein